MQDDWKNYEYFRCVSCGKTWRRWSVGAYDITDTAPRYQDELCNDCIESGGEEKLEVSAVPALHPDDRGGAMSATLASASLSRARQKDAFARFLEDWATCTLVVMSGGKVGRA